MLVNDITKKWVEAYIARPSAALLLESQDDIESTIPLQEYIYKKVTNSKTPNILIQRQDKKSIGVEEIREINKQLSLQSDRSTATVARMVSIISAEYMTVEAQNALLKLLEELPRQTILCLTTANSSALLGTIQSRCFTVNVLPISRLQAMSYAKYLNIDRTTASRAYMLSEGRPSIFESIVSGDSEIINEQIELAKIFIGASVFDRQKMLSQIISKENNVNEFLRSLKIVARAGLHHARNLQSRLVWKNILQQILRTEDQLDRNVSTKLSLLSLSVSI